MRKLILLIVLCTCGLFSQPTTAQVSFRANISIQPIWGPVGYDHVEYYYLPEVEAYYYVPTHMYFFMEMVVGLTDPNFQDVTGTLIYTEHEK